MGRVALTAVVATVVDMVYGFLVYGMLLGPTFDQYPGVFRGSSDTSHIPYLAAGVFLVMFAAAYAYPKGYEGGSAVREGLCFGAVVATLMVGMNVINYAVLNVGRRLTLMMSAAAIAEFLLIGLVIALVSNPARPAKV